MKRIPKTVVALGVASFFTDFSSEMIYPLLPLFLSQTLGAGALALGVIEGVAESTASLLKLASGIWTDRVARRKPFVLVGYGLAGLVRPLIGLAGAWPFVLAMRFLDRVGKGLRTSPRDALIADVVDPSIRGAAYGFHRMMDHAGAVVGPLTAAALLTGLGLSLRTIFLLAAIPAAVVMAVLVFGVTEQSHPQAEAAIRRARSSFRADWRALPRDFRVVLGAVFVFTLGNSTDAFMMLRMADAGFTGAGVALLWAAHHVVKMGSAYAGGSLSDRVGRRRVILAGWGLYAAVYAGFAATAAPSAMIPLFLVYGLYHGLVEPSEKAWVADLAPPHLRGTAMGLYHAAVGIAALPASLVFGLLWKSFGAPTAFLCGAVLALAAAMLLMLAGTSPPRPAS